MGTRWITGLQFMAYAVPKKSIRAYRPYLDEVLVDARCIARHKAKWKAWRRSVVQSDRAQRLVRI